MTTTDLQAFQRDLILAYRNGWLTEIGPTASVEEAHAAGLLAVAKVAMEQCKEQCYALPVNKERCAKLLLPEQAWCEAQEQCAEAIMEEIAQIEPKS